MNRTIKLLIISDAFLITGFGLIEPILAVFIKEQIIGATLFKIGFATTLYLIVKSIIQIPFARYVDSHRHKVIFLVLGTFFIATVPFFYIFAQHINTIYLAQIMNGIGAALAYPTFLSIFSTHLDKKKEGFEWSIYSTTVGLMAAGSALVGAKIAELFGFKITFLLVGILAVISSLILLLLEKDEKKTSKTFNTYSKGKLFQHPHKRYH